VETAYRGVSSHIANVKKSAIFWDVMSCSLAEAYDVYDEQPSETSVKFYQTTRHHLLEDSTFHLTWVSPKFVVWGHAKICWKNFVSIIIHPLKILHCG
jgi:hypothetical protein